MSRAFEPLAVGPWKLPQRFVMAPLTRNRAGDGHAPTDLNAEYYASLSSVQSRLMISRFSRNRATRPSVASPYAG